MTFWRGVTVIIGVGLLLSAGADLLNDDASPTGPRPSPETERPRRDTEVSHGGDKDRPLRGCIDVQKGLLSMLNAGLTGASVREARAVEMTEAEKFQTILGGRDEEAWFIAARVPQGIAVWGTQIDPTSSEQESELLIGLNDVAFEISDYGIDIDPNRRPGGRGLRKAVSCVRV